MFNDQVEWKLDPQELTDIFTLFGRPVLDFFAYRVNYQLPRYVSWISGPNAVGVDAFTLDWGAQYNYAFPPFSLIPQVLQKIGGGPSRDSYGGPSLANSILVPQTNKAPRTKPSVTSQSAQHSTPAFQPMRGISIEGTTTVNGMSQR